ncbi:hypothetical protein DK926_04925 [Rhodococcus sp. Eu-32]|uniref:hypothetical protein n=1 Tax=Rhodococcus sp. Eu-32 TaxID=1017319 RepID=UPI000DF1DC59|nr:hypothetical protein [Rhodococcus sp. Eu-32]RRQ29227.1 hypothetical protein DK926_04925 [Rhodococcus sp. Eu-32]
MMGGVPVTKNNPQYDEPPVRSVVLTVYYAPISDLGLPLALELSKLWMGSYPAVSQETLRPRPPELPATSPFEGDSWPFPRIVQTDSTLSRAISYQFDQISLRWTFDGGVQANKYPGFEELFLELTNVYNDFLQVVNKISESHVIVQGCGCEYSNSFDATPPENWAVGFMTGWSSGIPDKSVVTGQNEVFIRFSGESAVDDVDKTYSVQASRGKTHGSSIRIRATARYRSADGSDSTATESVNEFAAVSVLMNSAHDLLIEKFESASSDSMKEEWGKHESSHA